MIVAEKLRPRDRARHRIDFDADGFDDEFAVRSAVIGGSLVRLRE